uniref:Uncharacterized protein n=1 Tax=Romanomermis culicivorax TaxID=13658 RepID=A0A915KXC1_ROMCU
MVYRPRAVYLHHHQSTVGALKIKPTTHVKYMFVKKPPANNTSRRFEIRIRHPVSVITGTEGSCRRQRRTPETRADRSPDRALPTVRFPHWVLIEKLLPKPPPSMPYRLGGPPRLPKSESSKSSNKSRKLPPPPRPNFPYLRLPPIPYSS